MERRQQLQSWIAAEFPGRPFELAPASADASFRRYFRLTFTDDPVSLIVMDAPPSHEDCRPYIKVAALFGATGVHVPKLIRQNLEQGFLLLSDLGSTTYLDALTKDNAHNLYAEALGALMSIQASSQPGVLPEYDRELLMRELELFPVWYVSRHKGITLTEQQTAQLYEVFDRIVDVNLAEPKVYVHRDYHSRNLMVSAPNPGVLDFQDAVYGPMTYDLASLFKDAYIHWEE
ncbi:MAG TPA: phosphotransferase, partial [Zoogloea sp.]|nr:phosphotransferase [Zoogloea sp.]